MLGQHWVSADGKKHESGAIHLQKTQWSSEDKLAKSIFRYFFCKNPITDPTFFLYIKLLISLLNGALFRLGENFSVRGYGAKFWAGVPHQLFKADSKNPSRLLLRSRFGEKTIGHLWMVKTCFCIQKTV